MQFLILIVMVTFVNVTVVFSLDFSMMYVLKTKLLRVKIGNKRWQFKNGLVTRLLTILIEITVFGAMILIRLGSLNRNVLIAI